MAQLPHQVVVLGAGYAGLLAAVRLAGRLRRDVARGDVAITLVNAADVFVERLRLHQLAANRPIDDRPMSTMRPSAGSLVRWCVSCVMPSPLQTIAASAWPPTRPPRAATRGRATTT